MIKRLIWTIWTLMSSASKRPINWISLSLSGLNQGFLWLFGQFPLDLSRLLLQSWELSLDFSWGLLSVKRTCWTCSFFISAMMAWTVGWDRSLSSYSSSINGDWSKSIADEKWWPIKALRAAGRALFLPLSPSGWRGIVVTVRAGGRAGGCQTCGTHISVTAWRIFSIWSSMELSRPVVVHCHGNLPIFPIWACPWAKNLSNLPQIGSRLCGTHISETAGWIYPI